MTVEVSPSLLAADLLALGEAIHALEAVGAESLHLDVMDGWFVPNLSFGLPVVRAVRRATELPLTAHLMIERPERFVEDFVEAGASTLLVHCEQAPNLHRTVESIRRLGAAPGVVLNPATGVEAVVEILPAVDVVLVMTVDPGFSGQGIVDGIEDKVRRMAALIDRVKPGCTLAVDGGIDASTAPRLVAAGATVLVAGSAVFGDPRGAGAGLRTLRDAVVATDGGSP